MAHDVHIRKARYGTLRVRTYGTDSSCGAGAANLCRIVTSDGYDLDFHFRVGTDSGGQTLAVMGEW